MASILKISLAWRSTISQKCHVWNVEHRTDSREEWKVFRRAWSEGEQGVEERQPPTLQPGPVSSIPMETLQRFLLSHLSKCFSPYSAMDRSPPRPLPGSHDIRRPGLDTSSRIKLKLSAGLQYNFRPAKASILHVKFML